MAKVIYSVPVERIDGGISYIDVWHDGNKSFAVRPGGFNPITCYNSEDLRAWAVALDSVADWLDDHLEEDGSIIPEKQLVWQAPLLEAAEPENKENIYTISAGESVAVWVNQGWRDAQVLAVIEEEALIEYEMTNGTTSLLKIKAYTNAYYNSDPAYYYEWGMGVSYGKVPKKWLQAIVDQNNGDWWANPQSGKSSVPKLPEPSQ